MMPHLLAAELWNELWKRDIVSGLKEDARKQAGQADRPIRRRLNNLPGKRGVLS